MTSALRESKEHGQAYGSSKVKVTILASEWGSSKGGLSTINRELAIQLAKFPNVEITFFLPKCSEQDKKEALGHKINIVEAKRRPGYKELEWLSFPPDHLQIDVIVGHGVKLGRQAQVIRDSHKCKWVQVVHTDPEELGMFKCYSNPISKGEEKHNVEVELCEMANCVIGVGPKLSEAFRSYLRGCQKDRTVYNFTPGVFDEFVSVQQVSEEREHFCILVFGRGDAEDFRLKGFDVAAKAVASLNDTRLTFVGAPDGKHEETAKRLLDCGISASNLKVRGCVESREDLKRLFCQVDMVLMPSRTEGFGLTGLEALSAGLPVLVSKNSGFGEALRKVPFGSYFVIDSEDPKVWAAGIKNIWEKDRQTRLEEAKNLRDCYEKRYTWAKQCNSLLKEMITMVYASSSSCQSSTHCAGELASPPSQISQRTDHHPVAARLPVRMDCEIPQNANVTQQQVLNLIAKNYLQTVKPSTREEHREFVSYLEDAKKALLVKVESGSLIITLECSSLEILEGLWEDYCSGHLNEMAQKCLVTKEILQESGLLEVTLVTTILEEDYRACQECFLHFRGPVLRGSNQKTEVKDVEMEVEDVRSAMKDVKIDVPVIPPEIKLRGRLVLEAYYKALDEGKTSVKRVPVMLIGQDCSGKTSVKNSLMGKPFVPDEEGTKGKYVDPRYFKVSTEVCEFKTLLQVGEKVKEKDNLFFEFWDFRGQSVHNVTHELFLTEKAMYLLAYDLSRDPQGRAKPIVEQGMFALVEDSLGTKTNLDNLDFWMSSVASLANQDEDHQVHVGPKSEVLPGKLPPVFLVCTHADKPYGGADPYALAHEVYGSLRAKPYKNLLFKDVFVVDNTKSGLESECSETERLRENVLAAAKELPWMKEVIPVKWLIYEKALQVTKKEGHKWISRERAEQIASKMCNIDEDQEFLTLMNFLHDRRILIHFDDSPVLNNFVVLDLQWLIDVFKQVLTIKPCVPEEREFKDLWLQLQSTGILVETLLQHVWGPIVYQKETFQGLVAIMEKFSLLCPWPSSDASCGKQYLVPSMLMSPPPQEVTELVASAKIPSLLIKFETGRLPVGLFPRLVLQFFQWGKDEFWSSMNPRLFHNFAQFYISGDEECFVLLLCHSSSIEVVFHSPGLGDGLQSKLSIAADARNDAFEVARARAVQRQLDLTLESMRREFCWLKNMRYEMGVICPVCCQGRVVKYCRTHHKQGCKREECLHFWSESELRSAKQFIICNRLGTALSNKVEVKQFEPWFEQLAIDERGGRLLYSDDGIGDKSLTLPSKVVETLLYQSSDAKQVVRQLKQRLQLDQVSLEQPEPGIKRLIRCLATQAKWSNRLDVVKHLREIAPAGTTGPLLPDHLNIRDIPFRQMRELTIDLSGGSEWMKVAEKLGFTSSEIRFLDRRTLNPLDAVLGIIARRDKLTVGDLYDVLNECGLPVEADHL